MRVNVFSMSIGESPHTALEREAKLGAPAGFRLPNLEGLLPGATATALPERRLDAVYYDTADLSLARSGITLRHRNGDAGPAWVVKLPAAGGRGAVLSRREIGFSGPPDRIPEGAADLVLASTRGRRLAKVADLATLRRPLEIRGRDGRLLAELVDDTVSVRRGRDRERFREIEVELRDDGPDARRALDAAVSRLTDADCVAAAPVPKLVRALGKRAARPADVVPTPLPKGAGLPDLVRYTIARSVARLLRHDPGVRLGDDIEDVHQLRVAARRLRSDLATFGPLLDRERVAEVREELKWLGAEVGAVRDLDVLTERLQQRGAVLPEEDREGEARLMQRLAAERASARATMLQAMREPRYLDLLDSLVRLAAEPPMAQQDELKGTRAARAAARLVRRKWKRLAAAAEQLGADSPDEELHEVRILAKRCRYAAEAVAPIEGRTAVRFADAVAGLQTVLGDHQDTVVAEDWLRGAAAVIPSARLAAGQLIGLERADRADLRAQWPGGWRKASRKKLRQWL
jgi:CHAD domain-containing protein